MNEEVEKGEVDVFDRKVEREDTLVGKLLSRGLVVSDELQLRKIIRLVGYYRLTGYLYPFRQEGGEGMSKGRPWSRFGVFIHSTGGCAAV